MRAILAIFMIFLSVLETRAGAWPRGTDKAFLSFGLADQKGHFAQNDASLKKTIYGEFGLSEEYTAVFKYEDPEIWKFSVRQSFPQWHGHVFAVSFGGSYFDDYTRFSGDTPYVFHIEGHWGYGFSGALGNGWLGVDIENAQYFDGDWYKTEINGVVGFAVSDRWMLMLGGQRYRDKNNEIIKVIPGVAYQFSTHTHWKLGFTEVLSGQAPDEIELALWVSF